MPMSVEENDLMCRVESGAPMGRMMSEYWWPVLRSEKLVADGAPERVRLLGGNYVAFRATDGRVGFMDEGCPHRHVSMALARNEDCALRCLMHGWKIDVEGNVVETPNEFGFSRPERIKTHNYPVRESGGMVWVFVGEGEPSPFPNLAFNQCEPGTQVLPVMAKFRCNWVQLLETLWDPAHVQLLHGDTLTKMFEGTEAAGTVPVANMDVTALAMGKCESIETDFGFMYRFNQWGAAQSAAGGTWTPNVMPSWLFMMLDPTPGTDRAVLGHVPIDDENTILWQIAYNTEEPLGPYGHVLADTPDPDNWRDPKIGPENCWGQDREAMRYGDYTGIGSGKGPTRSLLVQDIATAESMGPITDRSWENLGPADMAVIKGRNFLLKAVKAHMRGEPAWGAHADVSHVGKPGGLEATLGAKLAV